MTSDDSQCYSFRTRREGLVRLLAQTVTSQHTNPNSPDNEHTAAMAEALIQDGWRERATDIHLDPHAHGTVIRLRIDGVLYDAIEISPEHGRRLINQYKVMSNIDPGPGFFPRDARHTHEIAGSELDMRVTVSPSLHGETMSIRLLDPDTVVQRLGALGLTPQNLEHIENWLAHLNGMFLCAGPTGSGKTTTLYTLLHELKMWDRNVITIEDPIEYDITGITQIQVDRRHALTFAEGLKSMLRLDPDYLMVGEIRDAETARIACDASMKGRVLMSTIHSSDTVGTVGALRSWNVPDQVIGSILTVVVGQRLVRRLCKECRREERPTDQEVSWLEAMDLEAPDLVWRAVGCEECGGTGYLGRIGLFEVWRVAKEESAMVLEHRACRHIYEHMLARDQKTIARDGLRNVAEGITSMEELSMISGLVAPLAKPAVALAKAGTPTGSRTPLTRMKT